MHTVHRPLKGLAAVPRPLKLANVQLKNARMAHEFEKLTSFCVIAARRHDVAGIQIDDFLESNCVNVCHLIINRVGVFNVNDCVWKIFLLSKLLRNFGVEFLYHFLVQANR